MSIQAREPTAPRKSISTGPNWDRELTLATRRVAEIAALAGDARPLQKAAEARAASDPAWGRAFDKVLQALIMALYPERRPQKVSYDPKVPYNRAIEAFPEKHKNMLVDVGDAVIFLAEKYGTEGMPPGFLRLFEHHKAQRASSVSEPISVAENALSNPGLKLTNAKLGRDQRQAADTKAFNRLQVLLYAVVEGECGWVDGAPANRNAVLKKLLSHVDLLNVKSYGLSIDRLEETIDLAMAYVKRNQRDKTAKPPSVEGS